MLQISQVNTTLLLKTFSDFIKIYVINRPTLKQLYSILIGN